MPRALVRAHHRGFHLDLGDLPTWLLAVFALGALGAAWFAYREQRKAGQDLAEQVKLQGAALADQRRASSALAEQAEVQRQALVGQQEANRIQGEVLQAELRELNRRADAMLRQQADMVTLTSGGWQGPVPGVRKESGLPVHEAVVTNNSNRPLRDVACRLKTQENGVMYPARLVAKRRAAPPGSFGYGFFDQAEDTEIRLLKAGETANFVFVYDVASHHGIFTLRFTDDADLHWQVDNDLHLERLTRRDWLWQCQEIAGLACVQNLCDWCP